MPPCSWRVDWKINIDTMALIIIFKKINYSLLVLLTALVVFIVTALSSNVAILISVVPDNTLPLIAKVDIVANILYGYTLEPTQQSLLAMFIAFLFSINLAGIVYYVHLYRATISSTIASLSTGGIVSAVAGLSCISCGSLVAAFLASLFGASSLAIALPFNGAEFSLVSIILLLISISLIDKKLSRALDR